MLLDGRRLEVVSVASLTIDATSRKAEFATAESAETVSDFVRWGEPQPAADRGALVLVDGGRLFTDRPWSPSGLVKIDEATIAIRRDKEWVDFSRDTVRWVVLSAESAGLDLDRLIETPAESPDDLVLLRSGDRLSGRVLTLGTKSLAIEVAEETVETPVESVAAVRLAGDLKPSQAACLVGLDDGSLLYADSASLTEGELIIESSGGEIQVDGAALAFVQPLNGAARYLSDLEAVDYRHTPYLDLAWPYARDRGLRGQPLQGSGRRSAKGIALHSAARLVYKLDGAPQRFAAELAIADPAPGEPQVGSIVGRVYLAKDGKFELAFDSGVVRAGEPPRTVEVDATGAAGLALVIDYADNGDAGDTALWLDARLIAKP